MNFAEKYGPWAVVTGAAAGMGLAYVRELHRRGLGVVLVDVDPAVEQIAGGLDGLTRTCVADVADPAWTSLLAAATEGLEVGLAIANAPWGLEDDLKQLLPWLAGKLAQSQGAWRLDWLISD